MPQFMYENKSLNTGQQFHQYQQNKTNNDLSSQLIEYKKTMTHAYYK